MRQQLMTDKTNADSFNEIENTLFCVCLDESSPANDQEMSMLTFIGNGHNRYYDRNFQMISFANGQCCVNAEHTWADALIVSDLFDHINETADEMMKTPVKVSESLPAELEPRRLCWVMSATTGEGLARAQEHYNQLKDSIDICAYKFNAFGKTAISKSFGLSPDAFIQMAMQLAHLRLHKKVVLTYESSHTRRFWHGRTEAVRSCSLQSTAFAKAMDTFASDDRDSKKYLLQQACEAHVNTIKQNMAGQGFDRHMLMLKVISNMLKQPLPEIYRDKVQHSPFPFPFPSLSSFLFLLSPLSRHVSLILTPLPPCLPYPHPSRFVRLAGVVAGFRTVYISNSVATGLRRRVRPRGCRGVSGPCRAVLPIVRISLMSVGVWQIRRLLPRQRQLLVLSHIILEKKRQERRGFRQVPRPPPPLPSPCLSSFSVSSRFCCNCVT
jgi:hypothetical protein